MKKINENNTKTTKKLSFENILFYIAKSKKHFFIIKYILCVFYLGYPKIVLKNGCQISPSSLIFFFSQIYDLIKTKSKNCLQKLKFVKSYLFDIKHIY